RRVVYQTVGGALQVLTGCAAAVSGQSTARALSDPGRGVLYLLRGRWCDGQPCFCKGYSDENGRGPRAGSGVRAGRRGLYAAVLCAGTGAAGKGAGSSGADAAVTQYY